MGRKFSIFILFVAFVALIAVEHFGRRNQAAELGFAFAAVALFRFGHTLQAHGIAHLRRGRISLRTGIWLGAMIAFWYSTALWVWWARRTPTFPLFLLNGNLRVSLFFEWVVFAVIAGLLLEARDLNRHLRE